jgi:hypothetical protein
MFSLMEIMLQANVNFTAVPGLAMPYMQNVSFLGITGNYTFDSIQNRIMPFEVTQIRQGSIARIGVSDLSFGITLNDNVQWQGGARPQDRDPVDYSSVGWDILVASIVFCVIGCVCVVMAFILLQSKRAERVIKAASPLFLQLILLGCMLSFICLPLIAIDRGTASMAAASGACRAYQILLSTGFTLVFSSLLAKSYRIHQIYTSVSLKQSMLSDQKLLLIMCVLVSLDVLMNAVWLIVDPLSDTLVMVDEYSAYSSCSCQHVAGFFGASIAYKSLVMFVTCVLCFGIRDAPSMFNEAKQIFACVYQLTFITIMLVPVSIYVTNPRFAAISRLVGLTVGTLATLAILFVPILFTGQPITPAKQRSKEKTEEVAAKDRKDDVDADSFNQFNQKLGRISQMAPKEVIEEDEEYDDDEDEEYDDGEVAPTYLTNLSVDPAPRSPMVSQLPAPVPDWILTQHRVRPSGPNQSNVVSELPISEMHVLALSPIAEQPESGSAMSSDSIVTVLIDQDESAAQAAEAEPAVEAEPEAEAAPTIARVPSESLTSGSKSSGRRSNVDELDAEALRAKINALRTRVAKLQVMLHAKEAYL